MSGSGNGKTRNGWLEGRLRFYGALILGVGVIVAGIVVSAWQSQAAQDREISRNREKVGNVETEVDGVQVQLQSIDGKLDTLLQRP